MKAESRVHLFRHLVVALGGVLAVAACGDVTETLPPNEATGGTAPSGGAAATSGTGPIAGTGGVAGSTATAGTSGSAGAAPVVTWQEMSTLISGSCGRTMCHNGFQEPNLLGTTDTVAQYMVLTTKVVDFCGPGMKLIARKA